MTRFYERLVDDGLLNCDPWDIGVPDHDEDTETAVVLPKDIAAHLPMIFRTYVAVVAGDSENVAALRAWLEARP